jgi:hypothetical protein
MPKRARIEEPPARRGSCSQIGWENSSMRRIIGRRCGVGAEDSGLPKLEHRPILSDTNMLRSFSPALCFWVPIVLERVGERPPDTSRIRQLRHNSRHNLPEADPSTQKPPPGRNIFNLAHRTFRNYWTTSVSLALRDRVVEPDENEPLTERL